MNNLDDIEKMRNVFVHGELVIDPKRIDSESNYFFRR